VESYKLPGASPGDLPCHSRRSSGPASGRCRHGPLRCGSWGPSGRANGRASGRASGRRAPSRHRRRQAGASWAWRDCRRDEPPNLFIGRDVARSRNITTVERLCCRARPRMERAVDRAQRRVAARRAPAVRAAQHIPAGVRNDGRCFRAALLPCKPTGHEVLMIAASARNSASRCTLPANTATRAGDDMYSSPPPLYGTSGSPVSWNARTRGGGDARHAEPATACLIRTSNGGDVVYLVQTYPADRCQ
jgi:hypothetical protein